MNILLINGSPRGKESNTYKLSKEFVSGIFEETPSVLEELTVKDMDIRSCTGCFSCWNKTQGKCVIKDDMAHVLEMILWADIIVWSFGLYYFNVPGKLKLLIDRQLPLMMPFMDKNSETGSHPMRYDMSSKRHVVISTCGFYTSEGNYDSVDAMFNHFWGKDNYETIYCGQGGLFCVPKLHDKTNVYLKNVHKAGTEFANCKISAKTKEKLETLLLPRKIFEEMADASREIDLDEKHDMLSE